MDDPSEFYFVQDGFYEIGYEINKISKYRVQFGPRTLIGSFNLAFDLRHQFKVKASSDLQCMSMRKRNWK